MKNPARTWSLFLLLSLLAAGTAFAHKVHLFSYVEGGTVYTESYFPDGTKVENGQVLVYNHGKQLLLEGKTDCEGHFAFPIPLIDDLIIEIDAGLGHRNSFRLNKTEMEAGR